VGLFHRREGKEDAPRVRAPGEVRRAPVIVARILLVGDCELENLPYRHRRPVRLRPRVRGVSGEAVVDPVDCMEFHRQYFPFFADEREGFFPFHNELVKDRADVGIVAARGEFCILPDGLLLAVFRDFEGRAETLA